MFVYFLISAQAVRTEEESAEVELAASLEALDERMEPNPNPNPNPNPTWRPSMNAWRGNSKGGTMPCGGLGGTSAGGPWAFVLNPL